MRSDTAFPWAATIKAIFAAIGSAVLVLSLTAAAVSHESNSGHPGHHHALAKVKHAASSARGRMRAVATRKGRKANSRVNVARGQQGISPERAEQIQEALIREHYLDGEPSGVWDQRTKDAMTRYQAENGWQTKITPDARALIKLGLGPKHDGLLNPDSAELASPHELGVEREIPGGADRTGMQRNDP